jgi:ribose transport system permease protein
MSQEKLSGARMKAHVLEYGGMIGALVLLILFFTFTTERFFSLSNVQAISNQIPAAIIVAVGMTYVLLIGGIDLSVGSALALCSAVFAVSFLYLTGERALPMGISMPLSMVAATVAGIAVGFVNGKIVTKWSVPSFIVTLAMLEAARGLTYMVTDSQTQYVGSLVEPIRAAAIFGVSLSFIVAIIIAIVGQLVLSHTPFGRQVVAVGYKEEVAYLSGINRSRVKLIVFTLCGALVGVASVIHTARLSASDPNSGLGFELEAIAAVVIGGTSLTGGRGSVIRSLFGVLVIAILGSGLAQAGAQEHTKRLITGLVIVVAVILDRYRQRDAAA